MRRLAIVLALLVACVSLRASESESPVIAVPGYDEVDALTPGLLETDALKRTTLLTAYYEDGGQGVRMRTRGRGASAGVSGSVLQATDIEWLGTYKVPGNDLSGAGIGVRYVGGVPHVLIGGILNEWFAPSEWVIPAVWNADGTCASGCPSTTYASAPSLTRVGSWNRNADNSQYNFYHAVIGSCYSAADDCSGGAADTPSHRCSFDGFESSGGCVLNKLFMVPGESGAADRLYFNWSYTYGRVQHYNFGFCTLDQMPVTGTTDPVSTCYGPFDSLTMRKQHPTGDLEPAGTFSFGGSGGGLYFVKLPDGSYGWGGEGSFYKSLGPAGPNLWKIDGGLPGTTTTSFNNPIVASTKYLDYYGFYCCDAHGLDGLPRTLINNDGSLPSGQEVWSYKFHNYAYVWDGTPCAPNTPSPISPHLTPGGCPGNDYIQPEPSGMLDPLKNDGLGSWTNELDSVQGMVWYTGANRSGVISFITTVTNHTQGMGDEWLETLPNGTGVARNWYCNGEFIGDSGVPCAGKGVDDIQGTADDGDRRSPHYMASCGTRCGGAGPVGTYSEPTIIIYDPADLNAVAAGTKTDYTVEPVSQIYPLTDYSPVPAFCSNAPTSTDPLGCVGPEGWGGVARDPVNSHIIYVSAPFARALEPAIHVFRVYDAP